MTILVNDKGLRIEQLQLGPYGTNAYILTCPETKESVIVDAPAEADKIVSHLEGTTPKYILLTHSHMDHIGAMSQLRSMLKIPLAAHAADSGPLSPPPEVSLRDGDTINFGKVQVNVMHTPGHTPGSLCFKVGNYLVSGDTLFPGGPGRTGTPADLAQVIKSITEKIFTLDDNTPVYPGHGDSTTVEKEKEGFRIFSSRPHDPNLCGDVLWLSP